MKKFWEDFKKFITRGNVVDMAVGVAVAGAFTAIVTAFTKGFISPLLALLSGDSSLADMKTVIRPAVTHLDETGAVVVDTAEVAILWGGFLQAILDFLIIALALFIVMRVASGLSARAKKLAQELKNKPETEKEKAEAQLRAKAEAEAKAAEEAAAAAKAAEEARIAAEEKEAARRQEQLLTEIRDLLKKQ